MGDVKPIVKNGKLCCPKCGNRVTFKHIITDIEYYCSSCGWFYYSEI